MVVVGITDSEKLGLVRVNFDMIDKGVKVVYEVIAAESFKKQSQYPELFKGIRLMDGEISIKLKNSAILYIEPVHRVPHVMQEPLKKELHKLVDEMILHKVDIAESIEWLNSLCV